MPSIQPITLANRDTPAEDFTLTPVGKPTEGSGQVATYDDGVLDGQITLDVGTKRPKGGAVRSELKLKIPVVQTETINGISAPKVVREITVLATMISSHQATNDERNNALGMLRDALNASKTLVNDAFVKAEYVW